METSLLDQGFELMLVGMGTVFVFLTLLVFGMTAMSAIARRLAPVAVASDHAGDDPSEEVIAAISTAISLHKNKTAK